MIPAILFTALAVMQPGAGPLAAFEEAIMLDDYGPCGLTSLFLVCRTRQMPVEWEPLKDLLGPVGPDGSHSFADLSRAAATLGMHPVGLQVSRAALNEFPMPAIVQVHDPRQREEPPHLLVLLRSEPDGVSVLDAPYPAYFLPESRFAYTGTGNVLIFARDEDEAVRIRMAARTNRALGPTLWIWLVSGALVALALTWWRWASTAPTWMGAALARVPRRATPGLIALLFMVAGSLAAVYYWQTGRQTDTPPRCLFDRQVIDLGELAPGETKYTVTIINAGSAPLWISNVVCTCSCAVVKAPEVVETGQSAAMEVQLNVPPGPRGARLTIESNDPEEPKSVVLSWHGKLKPRLVPHKIDDQAVPSEHPYERTVRLVYPGGKSALSPRLERCECDSPLVRVWPGKNDPLATRFARSGLLTQILGEQELHVEVQALTAPGLLTSKCTLFLKYGETFTTLDLPLSINFLGGELRPDVSAVLFSAASAEELKGQERLVRITDGNASGDLLVNNVPPWLECQVLQERQGESLIRLRVVNSPPGPLVQQTLQVARVRGSGSQTSLRVSAFAPPR